MTACRHVVTFLVAALLLPAALAQSLVLGTKLELNTLDPHFFNAFPTGSSHMMIYDPLVYVDPNQQLQPGLATSWRVVDDTTWEFKLRRGVKFHDGSDFTADDVIATFERVPNVPNSPNSFAQFVRGIASVTKQGDDTLVIKTKAPNPKLAFEMSRIFIVPAKIAKSATTADFNSGKAAIGTGPYKVVEWVNGDRLVLARNDAFWGPKEPWAKATEKVIAKDPTRVAALIAGEVDAIDLPATADLPRLRADPRVQAHQGRSGARPLHRARFGARRVAQRDREGRQAAREQSAEGPARAQGAVARDQPAGHRGQVDGGQRAAGVAVAAGDVSGHEPEAQARSLRPAEGAGAHEGGRLGRRLPHRAHDHERPLPQ